MHRTVRMQGIAIGRASRVALAGSAAIALLAGSVCIVAARPADGAHAITPPASALPASGLRSGPESATQVLMRNVNFYVDPDVVLHIHTLRGTMASRSGGPVVFDDKRSFVIHVTDAEVGLTGRDLSALLNKYVFAYRGAPLRHLAVSTAGTEIVQTGVLHKGVDIPFEIRARLDVTPQGLIRIHPTRTRILGVNGDALMHALDLSLEKLIDLSKARGASVRGNDIFLDPIVILPPPAIDGRVTAVRVAGDEIVQRIGAPGAPGTSPLVPPDTTARSFMFYKGGTLRFGRLLMVDAEMQIVELDGSTPFAFDLDRYNAQLVAGYSRTLPDLGLEVYMRDVTKLGEHRVARVTLR